MAAPLSICTKEGKDSLSVSGRLDIGGNCLFYASAVCLHAEIVEVEIEVVSPSIVPSGNFAELNRTVTCMVLKANDRRTSCPCHDGFRGPRSDYIRQFPCLNCKGGDRWCHPLSSLRELFRAKVSCHLYGAQGQRHAYI
ncbi:hypothetical protein TNCV_1476751 [Trichonephila clavipes]|nr:hypothetical protein TNCV_1476751 [Trichonephila clavipes]